MGHKHNPKVINAKECAECNVPKGWGHEIIFENNELYCGKLLCFKAGAKFSMHYHLIKDETWYVKEGSFIYRWIDTNTAEMHENTLVEGDSVRQLPGQPHQLIALTDGIIFEVSTQHFDEDSYRVIKGDTTTVKVFDSSRGHVYHTLNNQTIDLRQFGFKGKTQAQVEHMYGWEAAMYWSNIHMKELEDFFPINPGDVFVDLGSNIGMSATYAELKGASKIYCVEPDPNVFECLVKNSGSNWVLENSAVSKYNGYETIKLWPTDSQISVQAITFNDFITKHNITKIDYLKIDIEGAELDVINSISDLNWAIIDKVFLEYHEDVYEFSAEKREGLINLLLSKGLVNYHIKLGDYQSLIYFWR
jgi:FkbM family methyltransferase